MISNAREWIDLVIAKANELRKAGVITLDISGISVTLTPYEPEPVPTTVREDLPSPLPPPEPEDPLDDPATYGRTDSVPGFDVSDTDDDD